MASMIDSSMVCDHEVNLLTVGKTGAGKSTLANTALGKDVCPVSAYAVSENVNPVEVFRVTFKPNGKTLNVNVYDTFGFMSNQISDQDIIKSIQSEVPDNALVMLCLNFYNRCDETVYRMLRIIHELQVLDRLGIFFTFCDMQPLNWRNYSNDEVKREKLKKLYEWKVLISEYLINQVDADRNLVAKLEFEIIDYSEDDCLSNAMMKIHKWITLKDTMTAIILGMNKYKYIEGACRSIAGTEVEESTSITEVVKHIVQVNFGSSSDRASAYTCNRSLRQKFIGSETALSMSLSDPVVESSFDDRHRPSCPTPSRHHGDESMSPYPANSPSESDSHNSDFELTTTLELSEEQRHRHLPETEQQEASSNIVDVLTRLLEMFVGEGAGVDVVMSLLGEGQPCAAIIASVVITFYFLQQQQQD